MSKDVQKIQISQEKTERKRTQHIMIEQAKSSVRLAKKAKSSRLDMVHTVRSRDQQSRVRPDSRTSPSRHFTRKAENREKYAKK
jgi:hypothetical protein